MAVYWDYYTEGNLAAMTVVYTMHQFLVGWGNPIQQSKSCLIESQD